MSDLIEDRDPIYLWIVKEKAKTALPFSSICRQFVLLKTGVWYCIITMHFGWQKTQNNWMKINRNPSI